MKVEVENKILKISYLILNYTSVLVITIMGGGCWLYLPLNNKNFKCASHRGRTLCEA